jgi:hypothetical protein
MKSEYSLELISKKECTELLQSFHYLSKESKGFKSGVNTGLFYNGQLVGVCIFTGLPVPELAVGCFGLKREEQQGLWELSRLCLHPDVQTAEHNLASWFISKSIKLLRKEQACRAILSYADTRFHSGVVYRAANFIYYGTTAPKKDWYVDGIKASRGKQGTGEWRCRPVKHRFLIVFDKTLNVLWKQPAPRNTIDVETGL